MLNVIIEALKKAGVDIQLFNTVNLQSEEGRQTFARLDELISQYSDEYQRNQEGVTSSQHPDTPNQIKIAGTKYTEVDMKDMNILGSLIEHYLKYPNYAKGFITDIGKALKFEKSGSGSQYKSFILPDGRYLTVRLGKHNAKAANFDGRGEKNALSIVISRHRNKNINIQNSSANVIEYFYSKKDIESVRDKKPLADILRSLRVALITGEFKDTTGLAHRQEVKAEHMLCQILTDHGPFYSNVEKAVRTAPQEKATPAQWLAMLTKAGGIKAGEDRWLGMSEWLKNHESPVIARQDLLDYIEMNRINLYEDSFGELEESDEFRQLDDEFCREVAAVDERYRQADLELENFYDLMREKYSMFGEDVDDWLYWMTDDERDTEHRLLEERDSLDPSIKDREEIAFDVMASRYGNDFYYAFGYEKGHLLVMYSDETRKFISEEQPEEVRLKHTTKGLEHYRELALWTDRGEKWQPSDTVHFGQVGQGRCIGWVRFGDLMDQGKKVLVIDEVQSRRHQLAHDPKKGYAMTEEEIKSLTSRYLAIYAEKQDFEHELRTKYGSDTFGHYVDASELERLGSFEDELHRLRQRMEKNADAIPRAPFEKSWHELCMKRMLRYAAENGYDRVAWTTGKQQIDRYSLLKYVDSIGRHKDLGDDKYVLINYNGGKQTGFYVKPDGKIYNSVQGWNGKHINEVLGHEMAEKVLALPENSMLNVKDMTIGREGMTAFYDRVLPQFINRYTRQWGTSCVHIQLPDSLARQNGFADGQFFMHAIDVTPAMRESVMQGQALFMRDKSGRVYGWTVGDRIWLTPEGMRPETAVHEYTHVWCTAMQRGNPGGWQSVKDLLKDTPFWNEVRFDPYYRDISDNEDCIASEVLARISGRENAARIEAMADKYAIRRPDGSIARPATFLKKVTAALEKLWSWVGMHMFDIRSFHSVSEVADRVLYDLARSSPIETGHVRTIHEGDSSRAGGRISDITVFEGHYGTPHIRCRIDGRMQLGVPIDPDDHSAAQDPQSLQFLAEKYFREQLAEEAVSQGRSR